MGGTMSSLLPEIENYDACAASALKKAKFQTDAEIQTLTLEDLHDLFPGQENLKRRIRIFKIIYKQKQIHPFLKKLEDTQHNSLRGAVISECLNRIKETKDQLDKMPDVVKCPKNISKDMSQSMDSKKEADFQTDSVIHILPRENLRELFPGPKYLKLRKTILEIIHNQKLTHLLKELEGLIPQDSYSDAAKAEYIERRKNTKKQLEKMQAVLKDFNMPKDHSRDTNVPVAASEMQKKSLLNEKKNISRGKVRYKMVVSGETFGAHHQLLDKIKTPDLKMNDEEHDITIVFCPVVSRQGTDAEAAVRMVPGDGPVILVFMHYSQEPKHVSSSRILSSYPNVVLEVNIFYHDRKNGLLRCRQNENAVTELQEELKKYSKPQHSGSNHVNQSNSHYSFY